MSGDGNWLEAHLVRSNPIVKKLENPSEAVIAVSGGDAYISPDWYDVDDQVPTWNYIAVHIRGKLKLLGNDKLHGVLDRLSQNMEEQLRPKQPWKIDKLTPLTLEKMSRQIVAIGMDVSEINGTWKLSQNKPVEARQGVISNLQHSPIGTEQKAIANLMSKLVE